MTSILPPPAYSVVVATGSNSKTGKRDGAGAAREGAAEPISAAVEMVEAPAMACVVASSSVPEADAVHAAAPPATLPQQRRRLVQTVRDWLRRVA